MDRHPSGRRLGEGGGPRASGEALEVAEDEGEEEMSEGMDGAKPEKPGMAPVKYKGYEIFVSATLEGSASYGEFQIWKGDEKVNAGKVSFSNRHDDSAHDATERAAREWIDTQVAAD